MAGLALQLRPIATPSSRWPPPSPQASCLGGDASGRLLGQPHGFRRNAAAFNGYPSSHLERRSARAGPPSSALYGDQDTANTVNGVNGPYAVYWVCLLVKDTLVGPG